MKIIDIKDKECTCLQCGNKHELYGGKGYATIDKSTATMGNNGILHFEYTCKACGKVHRYIDRD